MLEKVHADHQASITLYLTGHGQQVDIKTGRALKSCRNILVVPIAKLTTTSSLTMEIETSGATPGKCKRCDTMVLLLSRKMALCVYYVIVTLCIALEQRVSYKSVGT